MKRKSPKPDPTDVRRAETRKRARQIRERVLSGDETALRDAILMFLEWAV